MGISLVTIGALCFLTIGAISLFTTTNRYLDVVGYIMAPSVMVLGVIILVLGVLFKVWRLRRWHAVEQVTSLIPHIDLTDPAHRRTAKLVVGCAFILVPVVGVSGYHGYHYTDSARFCAQACHGAMKPQATAYENSAHARVSCTECHVGSGATGFMKAKLSGTREVLATWKDSFPRPIPTATSEVQATRETCEQCHWPQKYYGVQFREIAHFAADQGNTRRQIHMLLKTGSGGDSITGGAEGIHKHMAYHDVRFVATDDKLQEIPWVAYTTDSGERLIYRSDGKPNSDPPPQGQEQTFDCIDCHNSAGHKFRSPQEAVDIYLDNNKIDATLPFIKRVAARALAEDYPEVETAKARIAASLSDFYSSNFPETWENKRASVNNAIDQVREIYEHNVFPEMNVDWRTYPDNIGHLTSPGCFRCHDDNHINQHGKTLTRDCNICHTFLDRAAGELEAGSIQKGEFVHSFDLQGPHETLRCDECHTGGLSPEPSCTGCHTEVSEFRTGTTAAFQTFDIEPDPMLDYVDCEGCHDLSQPVEAISTACTECHEDEEDGFDGGLAAWKREIGKLLPKAEATSAADGRHSLDRLRRAGPYHNMNASRKILQELTTEKLH